jgi:2-keto-3-deoxy-L-rhamnonate aldolase RhmA
VTRNRVREKLDAGVLALGAYAGQMADPVLVELIGMSGFDAVFIDLEHTALDLDQVRHLVIAADAIEITAMVRSPGLDAIAIGRLLDMGVGGIYVPHVRTVSEARDAVRAVRYPPLGERGVGPTNRSGRYGMLSLSAQFEVANRDVVLGLILEDQEAVDQIEEIAGVDGVDLVAVGISDLAANLGVADQPDHRLLVSAVERVRRALRDRTVPRLALPANHRLMPRSPQALVEMGVAYANCGPAPESRLLQSLMDQMHQYTADLGLSRSHA